MADETTAAKPKPLEPLILLEDEPVPGHWVDELSLQPFARVVAGTAVGTGGPFTVGVFADWGQGKTSVLRQAKSLIDHDPQHADVVTVWFNAWQYEKEEHPIVPLTASIVREVDRKLATRSDPSDALGKGFTKLARALRAVAYGFSAKAKWKVPGFAELEAGFVAKEMIDRYEKLQTQDDPLLERSLYYNAFEALEEIANPKGHEEGEPLPKIVVFVDDLDRCLPDQGLRLLESIKLVLAQRGFIFALAVDRRIIDGYLKKRYKEEFGVEDYAASGTSYLDKIVQLPLPLPPHKSRFEQYIRELLKRPALSHDKEVAKAFAGMVKVLAVGSNANPRSLVRFVNNLLVDWRIRSLTPGDEPEAGFLQLTAVSRALQQSLEHGHYRWLVTDRDLCNAIAEGKGRRMGERVPADEDQGLHAERRKTVLAVLERYDHLIELLDQEEAGQRWLREHEARKAVDEFLIVQRVEQVSKARSQAELVDSAIRDALGKAADYRLTDADRKRVRELNFVLEPLTDARLQHLAGLTELKELHLYGTQVTDAGLEHLSGLTGLQTLNLGRTQVSDAGLPHLAGLTGLQTLYLSSTQVTDAGLEHLAGLTKLRMLDLSRTQVTDAGLRHLAGLTGLGTLGLTKPKFRR